MQAFEYYNILTLPPPPPHERDICAASTIDCKEGIGVAWHVDFQH
jgi:hypothetical protein